jgi:hypothetical protein
MLDRLQNVLDVLKNNEEEITESFAEVSPFSNFFSVVDVPEK